MVIYLCPALMDWLIFVVLYAVLYGAGERKMSLEECAWLGGIFQVAYLMASPLLGLVLSRRNSRLLLGLGSLGSAALGAVCLLCVSFWPLMAAMATLGVSMALFFNAFQTYMRAEASPGSLGKTVALYTFAWSLGASLGFLSSGAVYGFGPPALASMCAAIGIAAFFMIFFRKQRDSAAPSTDDSVEAASGLAKIRGESFVAVAWVMIFTAMFVQRPLQTYLPSLGAKAGVPAIVASLPLCLHMFLQGLSGYGSRFAPSWLYRRGPIALVHGLAAALMLAVWFRPGFAMGFACVSALGLYAGFAYFFAVYYSSNSGRRSFNIGINECLVGVGSFAGLFIAQRLMGRYGDESMYLVCAATLVISMLLQLALASRKAAISS